MEANRDAAEELMRRGREAKQAGDLQRAVQLMQRACAMYSDRAQDAELRDTRMAYARERDARINAEESARRNTPPTPPTPRFPIPQGVRRELGKRVGDGRVDGLVGMCGVILVLLLLRFVSGGKALWAELGRLSGDINMRSGNMSVHFPLVSSMVISMLLSWGLKALMGYSQAPPAPPQSSRRPPPPYPRASFMNPMSWLPGVQAHANFGGGNVQMHGGVFFCAIQ